MNNNDHKSNSGADQETRQQVLALLNQLGDRLKRAEAEREGLREQLQEYRDQIEEIEDRAETTEKVYLNIENRLNAYDRSENELREELRDKVKKLEQVEARIPDVSQLEQKLVARIPDMSELEKKLTGKIPDMAALEKRLKAELPDIQALEKRLSGKIPDSGEIEKKLTDKIPDTKQLEERAESAEKEARQAREQAEAGANAADKLERRMEQLVNDNARMSRKLERLEEDIAKTDDALKSRAMVLLTDRKTAEQSGQGYLPAGGAYTHNISNDLDDGGAGQLMRLMQRPLVRTAGVVALILTGAGVGWVMNNAAQTGAFDREGAQMAQTRQTTQTDEARRTAVAQMNTTPHTTQQRDVVEEDADAPGQSPKDELSAGTDTGERDRSEPDKTKRQTKTGQQQESVTDSGEGEQEQQTASRSATETPAVRMNARTPSAGKSDRNISQALSKELPAQLGRIYEQARGAEKAAEDALMAEKPEKSLKQRLEPDTELPERFQKLQEQALNGDARAQHDLAALYTAGRSGVEQNYERAIKLFRASARKGVANARYNLGVLYHQGVGVEPDMQKAIRYYQAASLLGHAQARYNLGIAHIQGVGTKYNPRYAAAYFEKAARGGVVEAAYNLGLIYENGLAGKANADLALFWYHHAAESGSKQARQAMDQIARRHDLSDADIQQIIKGTDLDVTILTTRNEPEAAGKDGKDKQSSRMRKLPGEVKPAFAPSSDPDLIVQIQRQLSRLDLYSGKTDGDMGPKTRKAIRAYQDMHDLPETGESSEDLLVHMLSRSIQDSGDTQSAN